ncbi:reverse transcriptase domain-containing protein [Tanacetum coccineum]
MAPRRNTTTTPMTDAAIKALIPQGVATALAEYEANRGSGNGNDSHNSRTGGRRQVHTTRECTYIDFLKCQPLSFKGTKGVVGLTQWFKKKESVFHISNCTVVCQIKFATCTLQGNALTWWNSYVKNVSHEVAYRMTWKTLKKMMTDKYSPRREIKKLEIELWNLKVKGIDVLSYNQCFQELVLMCRRMFLKESDKALEVGLIRRIQGNRYGVLEFLGVGTAFDIFQNIHILTTYVRRSMLLLETTLLRLVYPCGLLVSAGTDTPYLP